MKNPVSWLRRISFVEGVSFLLLLFIAIPLKYLGGMPQAVTAVGWAHGLLFMLVLHALSQVMGLDQWSLRRSSAVVMAALLPAGPFVLDRWMQVWQAEASEERPAA